MFTAALFTLAKIQKQPKCPSTDQWIKKMWYTMEYYSAMKKNEILPFAATRMDLEGIMLREIRQIIMSEKLEVRERQILYDITYMWNLKNTTN